MVKMRTCILYFLVLIAVTGNAQVPVINSIQPAFSAPTQKVVITGSGFNTTSSQVWFDHVKGTVTAATNFSLEVQVPAQARLSNVEVINTANALSGRSSAKFLPSYGGSSFVASNLTSAYSDNLVTEPFDVVSSDLDLDGKPDLVVTKNTNGTPATDIIVYQNSSSAIGSINFTKTSINVGATTYYGACGDLNGDGKPEIIVSRSSATGSNRNQLFVLRNTNTVAGTLSFAAPTSLNLDVSQFAIKICIRDLNGDGKPELIVSNAYDDNNASTDNQIYIYPNQSSGGAISFGAAIKLSVVGANTTNGLDVQDLDGDGMPDIVLNQFNGSDIFIFRNVSTGNVNFATVQRITAAGQFILLTTADLNKDGKLDLITTGTFDNKVQIFTNQSTSGSISFAAPQSFTTGLGPWGVDVGDMDGDGDVDIVVATLNDLVLNIFRQDSPGNYTPLTVTTPKHSRNLRIGDYDGDGKPDIAFTSFNSTVGPFSVDVFRNANCWDPIITSPSLTICTPQTITLQTKPALGVTFDWKLGGVSQGVNALTFNATTGGSYTVNVTGTIDTGCNTTSPTVSLSSDPSAPPADPPINNNSSCLGGTLNLSTSTVSSATYDWTGPNGFTSTSQNPSITPVTNSTAGSYTLQVTVGSCSSNITSKLVDVSSVPVLPVTASPGSLACAGSSITLSVSGSGYSYQWNKDGSAISGQTGASLVLSSISSAQEGGYSVIVTNTSTLCSQETAQTAVKVFSPPFADFTFSSPHCKGTAIVFTNASTGDSRGALNYAWSFGDGGTSTLQSPSHTYASANTFNANLSVNYTGVSGCTGSKNTSLVVNSPVVPDIQATLPSICPGEASTLSITGNFSTISWVGVSSSSATVNVSQPGDYKVNTTDANGCTSKDSITVASKPVISPFEIVTYQDRTSINLGDTIKLSATSGADSYLWSPGKSLNDSTKSNPVASPSVTTAYIVVAQKTGFCSASDTIKITVTTGSATIKAPVLFSPNGDSFNDTWQIPETVNYPDWTMTIYDGRGSQVYQQKGYNSSNAWDGTYSGKGVPDGVYFFVFSNSTDKPTTGSVLVAR